MNLFPLDEVAPQLPQADLGLPSPPPPAPPESRGVFIHWWTYGLPTGGPEQRFAPNVPIRCWTRFDVPFTSLSLDGTDQPPISDREQQAYVRIAARMVEGRFVIPNPNTLLYEIRYGKVSTGVAVLRGVTAVRCGRPTSGVASVRVLARVRVYTKMSVGIVRTRVLFRARVPALGQSLSQAVLARSQATVGGMGYVRGALAPIELLSRARAAVVSNKTSSSAAVVASSLAGSGSAGAKDVGDRVRLRALARQQT